MGRQATTTWTSRYLSGGVAVLAVVAAAAGCSGGRVQPTEAASGPSPVERGAYLVQIAACNDCHTPFHLGPNGPEPDMSRMLSGHPESLQLAVPASLPEGWMWAGAGTNTAFAGPWGVSFAPNLTPDEETGFGIYTEETFIQAMRTGRHMGAGRPILPPMPWPAYGHMTDDDLRAVFAFLQTIPPIRNQVPQPLPPVG